MIEIKNLTKQFGAFKAVDDISFNVGRGEVLGFLGPNGAGKSTTMKMITGFLSPTHGTVRVCDHDVAADPMAIKSRIGYLPEGAPLYPDMTPASFLKFIAEVRGFRGKEAEAKILSVAQKVKISDVLSQRIETLSKGYKRRVGLAQAILHDPDVLILDEPTDGLDPTQKSQVRALIRDMAKDKVIVLSTHILEEVDAVCSRAIIIADGKLKFDGTPAHLASQSERHNCVELTLKGVDAAAATTALSGVAGVREVIPAASSDGHASFVLLPVQGQSILADVAHLAFTQGWEVDHISLERGRLDEVFREITAGKLIPTSQAPAQIGATA